MENSEWVIERYLKSTQAMIMIILATCTVLVIVGAMVLILYHKERVCFFGYIQKKQQDKKLREASYFPIF